MSELYPKKFSFPFGEYVVQETGELWLNTPIKAKNGEDTGGFSSTIIANSSPLLKRQEIFDNGIEERENYVFSLRRKGKNEPEKNLSIKEIMVGTAPSAPFGLSCLIYPGKGNANLFRQFLQIQSDDLKMKRIYARTGHAVIDGERVFLNAGYSITANGATDKYDVSGLSSEKLASYQFVPGRDENRYKTLREVLLNVAPNSVIFPGIAYAFLAPLNAILREKAIEPTFILYFVGKTGTGKSSLASVFLSFFGVFPRAGKSPASYDDTQQSVAKKMALLDSTLMLIDDRYPSSDPKKRAAMEGQEQNIARLIGDKASRERLNPDGSLQASAIPKCLLMTTAEEAYTNVGESAVARSLSVSLKPGDIDFLKLSEIQNHSHHLNQIMQEYIQYILQNWDDLVSSLFDEFIKLRDKAQSDGHKRLAESVAHMGIGFNTFVRFLVESEKILSEDAEKLKETAWNIFCKLGEEQNRRIICETPSKLFCEAVRDMLDTHQLRMIADKESQLIPFTVTHDGYQDDRMLYFNPRKLFTKILKYYDSQGTPFPVGKGTLWKHLANDGIIECGSNSDQTRNTMQKTFAGKSSKYLCVYRSKIYEDENEGGETP